MMHWCRCLGVLILSALLLGGSGKPVLRIRIQIRIRMFFGSISQRYGSGSFNHHAKIVRKTSILTVL